MAGGVGGGGSGRGPRLRYIAEIARYGEIWGDMGRYGEIWGDIAERVDAIEGLVEHDP